MQVGKLGKIQYARKRQAVQLEYLSLIMFLMNTKLIFDPEIDKIEVFEWNWSLWRKTTCQVILQNCRAFFTHVPRIYITSESVTELFF